LQKEHQKLKDAGIILVAISYDLVAVLAKQGVIRAKLFFDGPRVRHTADDIIKAAAEVK